MKNIAEILKKCPKGMELDCTIYNNIVFDSIIDYMHPIKVITKDGSKSLNLTKYGCTSGNENAKCVIFPKGKTTWEGFQIPFKDGDVVFGSNYACFYITIYKSHRSETSFNYYACLTSLGRFQMNHFADNLNLRPATEEEKQKLFKAIKDNGYRWNAETKTMERLIVPKFKVGDRIKWIKNDNIYEIIKIFSNCYIANYLGSDITILWDRQDEYELVSDKFDISTLKPFDKVLVRTDDFLPIWSIDFFGCYTPNVSTFSQSSSFTPFGVTSGKYFQQCIPYEGNEHLLGTTTDCDKFYKTW